jgi:opacity protein-like surface antigen
MNRTKAFMLFFVALAFFAVPALAAGPYVGGEAGAVFLSESTFSVAGIDQGDAKFKTGYGLGLLGGFDFGTWRAEGEFAWRKNDNKEFSSGGVTDPLSGDVSSMALMANGYYDFRMVSPTFVPYIGGGLGFARVSLEAVDPTVGGGTFIDDSDTVFAYQFSAGVGFVVSKQLTIDLGYKYFATTDPEFEVIGGGGVKAEAEYQSHNLFLGARYSF